MKNVFVTLKMNVINSLLKLYFTRYVAHKANPPPAVLAPQVLVPVAPLPVHLSAVAQESNGGWPKCLGPAPTWEIRRPWWPFGG